MKKQGAFDSTMKAIATAATATANVIEAGADILLDSTSVLRGKAYLFRSEYEKEFEQEVETMGGIEEVIERNNKITQMLHRGHGRI